MKKEEIMTILPFICLGMGIIGGLFVTAPKFTSASEKVSTVALIFLMLSIGVGIGLDQSVIRQFGTIGIHCVVIALCAIGGSVLFTVLCEKTVLPLDHLDKQLSEKNLTLSSAAGQEETEKKSTSHLVWIMPCSILAGLFAGIFFRSYLNSDIMDTIFTISLIVSYVCVGISQGANREVFRFVKRLGFRIIWLSAAILMGSILGGIIAGILLRLPLYVSVISASGMSFYSITGAYMTQAYGLEIGTYGFIVNVLREFFTVLLMPLLIKISLGSPIAGGAAGNMDTMLAPVTKFVGVRLGLVTLITGTILTLLVPIVLPAVAYLFHL